MTSSAITNQQSNDSLDEQECLKLLRHQIFYFHPTRTWELSTLLSIRKDPRIGISGSFRIEGDGDRFEGAVKHSLIYQQTPGIEQHDPDNLLSLSELHHSILLNVLRKRHQKDIVYTYLGDLVIALNPFKYTIPHYQLSMMEKYSGFGNIAEIPFSSAATAGPYSQYLHPHTWAVVHKAYVEMLTTTKKTHSVIISGESGAGKTETCKMLLKYLVHQSRQRCQKDGGGGEDNLLKSNASMTSADFSMTLPNGTFNKRPKRDLADLVNERVQQANPILEAFGNAKTARNDNSSRFGKFMEVQFDDGGVMVGMRTTPFLLEKSRVVHCGADERTYHCFYQLVAGAPPALRSFLRLKPAKDFQALCRGGCIAVRGIDDAADYAALVEALKLLGIVDRDQQVVWRILAAILHLQNLTFEEHRVTATAELSDANKGLCNFIASDLLELEHPSQLADSLISSVTVVRKERIVKHLTPQKAEDQRDSLCKHLYAKLFSWLVEKINEATACSNEADGNAWVGLLDIFGFEDMSTNGFEQLCINLTNETLQRLYTRSIFLKDIEDMRQEGINAQSVAFKDNAPCIELLQGATNSVLSMLDDSSILDLDRGPSMMAGGGQQIKPNIAFLNKLTAVHRPDFQSAPGHKGTKSVLDRKEMALETASDYFFRGRLDDDTFTIKHYASDVKYKVHGFVERNTDTLKESTLLTLLGTVDDMFKTILLTDEDSVGLLSSRSGSSGGAMSPLRAGSPITGAPSKTTASTTFRKSLALLKDLLETSVTHWVRCIRPHPRKAPGLFDNKTVLEQLVATGVLETVAQRQKNFPFRVPHADFIGRFGVVSFSKIRRGRGRFSVNDVCKSIVVTAGISEERDVQIGTTKVFLSSHARQVMEDKRAFCLNQFVMTVQGYLYHAESVKQKIVLELTKASLVVQRLVRLKLRLRKVVKEFYAEIHRRIHQRLSDERHTFYLNETKDRALIATKEADRRREGNARFLRLLLPLFDAIVVNIQNVERQRRLEIEAEMSAAVRTFDDIISNGINEAERKNAARLKREIQERHEARIQLHDAWSSEATFIRQEETKRRDELVSRILPELHILNADAADVAAQIIERDRELLVLEMEREKEVRRIKDAHQKRIIDEESLWKRHIGDDEYRKDITFLTQERGLTTAQALESLRAFYASRGPSSVVSGAVTDHRVGASVVSRGLGNVASFRDYMQHWKRAYEGYRGPNPTAMPSPYHSPTNKRLGMGRNGASPAPLTFDIDDDDELFDRMVLEGSPEGPTFLLHEDDQHQQQQHHVDNQHRRSPSPLFLGGRDPRVPRQHTQSSSPVATNKVMAASPISSNHVPAPASSPVGLIPVWQSPQILRGSRADQYQHNQIFSNNGSFQGRSMMSAAEAMLAQDPLHLFDSRKGGEDGGGDGGKVSLPLSMSLSAPDYAPPPTSSTRQQQQYHSPPASPPLSPHLRPDSPQTQYQHHHRPQHVDVSMYCGSFQNDKVSRVLATQHQNRAAPPPSPGARYWNNPNNQSTDNSGSGNGPKDASYYLNKAKQEVAARHRSAYLEQLRGNGVGSSTSMMGSPISGGRQISSPGGGTGSGGGIGLSPAAAAQREALLRRYQPSPQGEYGGVPSSGGVGGGTAPLGPTPLSPPNQPHRAHPSPIAHRYMSPVISSPNIRLPSSMFDSPSRVVLQGGTVRSPYHPSK